MQLCHLFNVEHKRVLLVVYDNPDLLTAVKSFLDRLGYSVETTSNPELVLQEYQIGGYDLLMFYWKLPKMSALDFMRKINETDNRIKICLLTVTALSELVKSRLNVGQYVLELPFSIATLESKLNEILEN